MGPEANEQAVGQRIGLLAAAGFFSRFLVAYAWGSVSDVVGRKVGVMRCSSP
jgi:MFS family permease